MSQIPYFLNQALPIFLHGICFIFAWLLVFLLVWSGYRTMQEGIANVKSLHEIPCSNCQFFTGNYQLKCTVNPKIALTEQAINCSDYSDYHNSAFYRVMSPNRE